MSANLSGSAKAACVREYARQTTGTEAYHRHPLGTSFTDGMMYVAETCGAYWLLDLCASWQPEIRKKLAGIPFQVWRLRPLDDGSVLCASEVPEGSLISLMKATDQSVIETSGRASRLALGRLEGSPPAGMIAFECVSQRLRVGEAGVGQQLMRVKNVVGAVPFAGCHGYGQLARTRGAFTGLMSASALVCLFPQV